VIVPTAQNQINFENDLRDYFLAKGRHLEVRVEGGKLLYGL
jgi:hypothetical protein